MSRLHPQRDCHAGVDQGATCSPTAISPGSGWAARGYVGWWLLDAGRTKLQDPTWMDGGQSVRLYWAQAVGTAATGRSWAAYAWYRECVQYMLGHEWYRWVGPAVAIGEVLIAIALILGLFSGLAALGAAFLNFNVLVAGGLVTNPVLFLLTVLLILVWRTAGRIGLDHWIFPRLGVRAAM